MKISFLYFWIILWYHTVYFCAARRNKEKSKENYTSKDNVRRILIPYDILPSDIFKKESGDLFDDDTKIDDENCPNKNLLDITYQDKYPDDQKKPSCHERMKYTQMEGCPKYKIPENQNCMEMGCTIGEPCTTLKLKDRKCCPHKINGIEVTCCLAKPVLPTNIYFHKSYDLPCPPVEIPLKHHCMQIGCTVGKICMNKGIEHKTCCPHTYKGSSINCCLAKPEVSQSIFHCPEYKENESYDCLEIGCQLGLPCRHQSIKSQTCCQYLISNRVVNCCLKATGAIPEKSKPIKGCPSNHTIPAKYQCLDIGCKVGEFCSSQGAEGITCCPVLQNGTKTTCCLKKKQKHSVHKSKQIAGNLKKCPDLKEISAMSSCIEIGCEEGIGCTASGFEDQICCPYLFKGHRISCCLPRTDKKASQPKIYPLSRKSLSGKCPAAAIPEGYNCMEIGCKVGDRCNTSGLKKQYCCNHQVNNVPVSCCVSLPRPEGCHYVKLLPNKFNCMEIGCKEGLPCSTYEVRGQTCCPYNANGYLISCCLVTQDYSFTH